MTEEQIVHLEEYKARFIEVYGRTPRQYAAEYSYLDDAYRNVCFDLGLSPRAPWVGGGQ